MAGYFFRMTTLAVCTLSPTVVNTLRMPGTSATFYNNPQYANAVGGSFAFPTLQGNAIIKAVEVANFAEAWAIADDTGLEVKTLGGAPGVFSARYAGEPADDAANRRKLLAELHGVADRSARFRTVVALVSCGVATGTHSAAVKLHADVEFPITLDVVAK